MSIDFCLPGARGGREGFDWKSSRGIVVEGGSVRVLRSRAAGAGARRPFSPIVLDPVLERTQRARTQASCMQRSGARSWKCLPRTHRGPTHEEQEAGVKQTIGQMMMVQPKCGLSASGHRRCSSLSPPPNRQSGRATFGHTGRSFPPTAGSINDWQATCVETEQQPSQGRPG